MIHAWELFGTADLGHTARNQCLLRVAASYLAHPGSVVTQVCRTAAERQATYGFLENDAVEAPVLTATSSDSALRRTRPEVSVVVAPIDGSSLVFPGRDPAKGLGRVGAHASTQGLLVLSTLWMDPNGTPLGLGNQTYWTRPKTKSKTTARTPLKDKETGRWLQHILEAEAALERGAPGHRAWFQLDRGFDCWPLFEHIGTSRHWFTVRACYDRRLAVDEPNVAAEDGPTRRPDAAEQATAQTLRAALATAPVLAEYDHQVRVRPGCNRQARQAHLQVRVQQVNLRLTDPTQRHWERVDGRRVKVERSFEVSLWAVQALEVGTTPAGEKPLDWVLLTNRPVHDATGASEVLDHYAQRWFIEDFHRGWKSGGMKVEESQLRHRDHLERLARLTAILAAFLLRLTHLARHEPSRPASQELPAPLIFALIVLCARLRGPKRPLLNSETMTLQEAVLGIAELGGYTGKSSGGPPGQIVLARGWTRLQEAAEAIAAYQALENRDQC